MGQFRVILDRSCQSRREKAKNSNMLVCMSRCDASHATQTLLTLWHAGEKIRTVPLIFVFSAWHLSRWTSTGLANSVTHITRFSLLSRHLPPMVAGHKTTQPLPHWPAFFFFLIIQWLLIASLRETITATSWISRSNFLIQRAVIKLFLTVSVEGKKNQSLIFLRSVKGTNTNLLQSPFSQSGIT